MSETEGELAVEPGRHSQSTSIVPAERAGDAPKAVQVVERPSQRSFLSEVERRGEGSKARKSLLAATTTNLQAPPASPLAYFFWRIARHPVFETGTLTVIILNAAWIGLDLDLNEPGVVQWPFIVGENVFCVIFTLELLIRWLSYEQKSEFIWDSENRRVERWHVFDLFLVVLMVAETWIIAHIASSSTNMNQLSTLRLLRLLRISRVFRLVPELGMMVKSMAAAARSVSSTLVLAVGIMYVFAILLTQWAKGPSIRELCRDDVCFDDFFGSIGKSLLSLLQIMVYDDTFALIRPTLYETWYVGGLLILFIFIGSFTVLNMLIGVICEIVGMTTAEEKEKVLRSRVMEVFARIDSDNSGGITRAEFDSQAHGQLEKLGIDTNLVNSAFDILDVDDSSILELEEFIHMIFKLLHPPEAQDILRIHQKLDRIADGAELEREPSPPIETSTAPVTAKSCDTPKEDIPTEAGPSPAMLSAHMHRLEELLLSHCGRISSLERTVEHLVHGKQVVQSVSSMFQAEPEEVDHVLKNELAQLSAQMALQSEQLARLESLRTQGSEKDPTGSARSSDRGRPSPVDASEVVLGSDGATAGASYTEISPRKSENCGSGLTRCIPGTSTRGASCFT